MSFLKHKDLDQMLAFAEKNYAIITPVVSGEGIRRARETIRLAKIGLDVELIADEVENNQKEPKDEQRD